MASYFARRLLLVIPTFLGVTLMVFAITRFVPGGPVERMIAQAQQMQAEGKSGGTDRVGAAALSEDQIKQLNEYYGLDKPVLVSYVQWLWKVFRLDLGTSSRYNEPVWDLIKSRFPVSISFGLATLVLTYGVCVPLGILKAVKHKSGIDTATSVVAFIGYAVPNYVVGILLIILFASQWELFPLSGLMSDDFADMTRWGQAKDLLWHAALPLAAYLAGSFAVMTFLTKNSLMDNLAADYVRTAIAKGLDFKRAVLRHALRNSLIPIATHFGNEISLIFSGSFLVETIFNINGFGLLGYESLMERDYPVVMGILVLTSLLFLIGNILSDVCVAFVDPRVKFQ
ncbi:MAG: microcin C transport system permease protein [Elusimicrobia bacterium]|nr:MAG: microcin C transport system permease protein [Elusimicrobiota bacterium]